MSKLKVFISSVALITLGFTGCTSFPTSNVDTPKPVYKIEQQCPANLTMKVGETLKVVADDNPSTGYSWKLRKALDHMTATSSYAAAKTEGYLIVGAGGVRTFNFTATSAGLDKIHLVYTRSWTPQEVGREWICDITVQ